MRHIYIAGSTAQAYTRSMIRAQKVVMDSGFCPEHDLNQVDDDTWVFGDELTVHWGRITGDVSDSDALDALSMAMDLL
jgi:hypothetical protein